MSTQIVSTLGVLGGKPRIDGTRISVELILEMFQAVKLFIGAKLLPLS